VIALVLLILTVGATVYALLVVAAARRYVAVTPGSCDEAPPMSVLKPLHGLDEGLERNLRSFFEQEYPHFEVVLAVSQQDDPAVPVVEHLRRLYPHVPSTLVVTGEPACPNAKVHGLAHMTIAARFDRLVMSDSDVRAAPDLLRRFAAEWQDARVGLITCPYRAVPGPSFWSTLEAIGLNTEFIGGVLVARMLEGMRFALGPTLAVRRDVLEAIGGMPRLESCLAEDFEMGQLVANRGWTVLLSSACVEHRIGAQGIAVNLRHRLRWYRSTRRSRPWGYVGQLFTYPLPLAIGLWVAHPPWWPVAVAAVAARALAAWATAGPVLHEELTRRRWYLLPIQDVASFITWIAGFFGNQIEWRGRRYTLKKDGTVERLMEERGTRNEE
jgi:ceramide glucosyltransferase